MTTESMNATLRFEEFKNFILDVEWIITDFGVPLYTRTVSEGTFNLWYKPCGDDAIVVDVDIAKWGKDEYIVTATRTEQHYDNKERHDNHEHYGVTITKHRIETKIAINPETKRPWIEYDLDESFIAELKGMYDVDSEEDKAYRISGEK